MTKQIKCDKCGDIYDDKQMGCISEKTAMPIFLGYYKAGGEYRAEIEVGFNLGDVCRKCQEELKAYILREFPQAKHVKSRAD